MPYRNLEGGNKRSKIGLSASTLCTFAITFRDKLVSKSLRYNSVPLHRSVCELYFIFIFILGQLLCAMIAKSLYKYFTTDSTNSTRYTTRILIIQYFSFTDSIYVCFNNLKKTLLATLKITYA